MGAWCGHAEVSRHPSRRAGQLDEVDSDALGTETPSVPKRLRAAAIRPTVAVSIVLVANGQGPLDLGAPYAKPAQAQVGVVVGELPFVPKNLRPVAASVNPYPRSPTARLHADSCQLSEPKR